jgi:RHS repeat-associated protein
MTTRRIRHSFAKLINITTVICLLSSSTPAAPQTIVTVSKESAITLSFWYQASGLAKLLQGRTSARGQEKQADRDAKVSRIQIFPGDVTVDVSERVRFAAVAYDEEGNTIGGVKVKWRGQSASSGARVKISPHGEFEALVPGSLTITAQAAGKTAQVTVTVRSTPKADLKATPRGSRSISTRDLPLQETASDRSKKNSGNTPSAVKSNKRAAGNQELTRRAHSKSTSAAAPVMLSAGWDDSNYWSADDPPNRVGDPPGSNIDAGAGSGNFQFAAPVISLAGRGINVSLSLVYNSRLWNKAGSQINYDNDRGWPAPGFNLGFGKLLGIGVYTGCMLVDADGTRHGYAGSITIYNWGTVGVMHTIDGSFIDYTYQTGTNGVITWAQARLANGTVISYGAYSQPGGGVFPTFIEDANGNFTTITYVNNSGPRIQTITDTAGRVVSFYYDYNNLLTAVTGPGLSGGTRTLVRLHYHQHTLNFGFNGLSASAPNYYPWVVDAIYYPGTATGFWLNDSDSYSSYGMLAKVVEQRAMGFSSSGLTDMGSVWQGSTTRRETYNYDLTPNYSLTDAPTYTTMEETWSRDGTNFDSATTGFELFENSTPRMTIITLPNGTKNKQLSFNAPGQYNDGLTYHDETYVSGGPILQSSDVYSDPGAYGAARPYRIDKTDERGQTTKTEFSYGSVYNQVTEVRDYDYGGSALLRARRMTYQNSANYTGTCYSYGCYGRHIFNLPLTIEVIASDYSTRVSRTEIQYDGQPLTAAPGVVMHDQAANPHAEEEGFCYWDNDWNDPDCTGNCYDYACDGYCNQIYVCPYDYSTEFRGNVTQVTNYAEATYLTGAVTETRQYDVTGNLVKTSSSCCDQTTFNYTIDTQYSYPQSQTRGAVSDPYQQVTNSATCDFNTGLELSSTDPNGRTATSTYDANSLRVTSATTSLGAHVDYVYDDAAMSITSTSYLASGEGGGIADKNVKLLNGRGQVRQEQALGANSVWDFVDTTYTSLGQPAQQTRPYRSGDTLQWSTSTYDALGRPSTVTAPDGSVTQAFYNEATRPSAASSSPGETTRVQDPWGRERWVRKDSSGRLVEVVEPDPNGSGSVATNGMQTTYSYNTLGKLTQTNQGGQIRSFKYDALGRLVAQKLAEKNATLNDAGTYVGSGTWSDVFTYDNRSNLTSATDARGVKTVYTYNSDPLNRLQSVSWDTSGFGDTGYPILPAGTVTYQYRQKDTGSQLRDITQIEVVTTASVNSDGYSTSGNTETYTYDADGRVLRKRLKFNNRVDYPFDTDYSYDSLDRVQNLTYPAQYQSGNARKILSHNYDVASRISSEVFDGQTFASNIVYNASSQTTSISIGTGTNQVNESYSYNAQTGLLDNQTLTRNGSTLLNLSYDYAGGANGKRTGQLTKTYNNLDHNKDRGYEYDALGRLRRATGGQNVNWAQRYFYDRWGNRNNVFSHTAEQYVRNFYQSALNRQPNSTELSSWLSTLQTAYTQGPSQFWSSMQSLGAALFTSQEYAARGRTDHWYVYDLYHAYLWRDPDSGGWSFWESNCGTNGRNATRAGFDWSLEFELHVSGTSPYSPPGGATVPTDGWGSLWYDSATNRSAVPGWYYDAAGNQTRVQKAAGWQRFQYDAANRMVRVKDDDNTTVRANYTYSDSNERLIGEEDGARTYYQTEGGVTMAEFTESGGATVPSWSKTYVYLGNRLLATLTPGGTQYHHPDRLGTRVITTPATGASVEQVNLPFGSALDSESTGGSTRRFTSYDRSDLTKLDYAMNRSYDSLQGRFTQVDPAGMRASSLENPQTLNLYSYVSNDPINRTDPDGLGLISFFKKLFRGIAKILTNKWVLLIVGITLGALAGLGFYWAFALAPVGATVNTTFLYAAITLAAMSAALIVGAFHQGFLQVVRTIGGIVSSVQGIADLIRGTINGTVLGTPPWDPDSGSGVGSVSSFMRGRGRRQRRSPRDHVKDLLTAINTLRQNLGARWNDFIETINNNKNSSISTEIVLCHASQESSFLLFNDTGTGFESTLVGKKGEIGLLQMKPSTASGIGVDPSQLTDVATNVTAATGYLTGLLNRNGGDLRTALGQYKGGGGRLTVRSQRYADQIIECSKQVKY